MKSTLLPKSFIYSFLIVFFCLIIIAGCKNRNKDENAESNKVETPSLEPNAKADLSLIDGITENCDEKVIEKKFLKWMDLYYPDWSVRNNIKVFPAEEGDGDFTTKGLCDYNIRFQTVSPHTSAETIIIVKFHYTKGGYDTFKIEPVRGTLY
jgi:hypothetical protein